MESGRIPINRPAAAFSCIIELSALFIAQAAMIDSVNPVNVTANSPSEGGYTLAETYGRTACTNTS
jgi:hypothetical protein